MNRYAAHQDLLSRATLIAQQKFPQVRFFDRHVGTFYTKRGTPIKINSKGMSDQYAWIPTMKGIINIEIEYKTGKAKQSPAQKEWQSFVEMLNGHYCVVRKTDDLINFIESILNTLNN